MTPAKTLAEYILQEETRSKQEKLGTRRGHDNDLTRALEIIAEDFRETAFGKTYMSFQTKKAPTKIGKGFSLNSCPN